MRKGKERAAVIFSIILYGIDAVNEAVFAVYLGNVLDAANDKQMQSVLMNAGICAGILLFSLILNKLALEARFFYVEKNIYAWKEKLMVKLLTEKLSLFHKKQDSYYLNLLSNDMETVEESHYRVIPLVFFYIFEFVAAVVFLLRISWKATILFIILSGVPILLTALISGFVAKRKKEVSEANELFTFELKEQIQGIDEIEMNCAAEPFLARYNQANHAQQKKKKRANITEVMVNQTSSVCGLIAQTACYALGCYFVIKDEITIGEFIAAIQLLNSVFNPITALSQLMTEMNSAKPMIEKAKAELKDGITDKDEDEKEEAVVSAKLDLDFEDVSIWYQEGMNILDRKQFQFEHGRKYAIVGDSGSGKSTLFKPLLCLHDNYDGSIKLAGVDIKKLTKESIYRHVAYVPQNPYLFNDTLSNNIGMLGSYSEEDVKRAAESVGLGKLLAQRYDVAGDGGSSLSGGERERIAIARAVIRKPEIIIFDEPTASLDPESRDAINELILGLEGYTCIVITHDRREDYLNRFDQVYRIDV